uniref:RNA binding motif protein 25 n=1 Tax=Salmo trutta TaxID=8032 RepID=A0A674B3R7_SALTR
MGIMTSAPTVLVPTTVSMVQKPPAQRKDLNPVRAKEIQEGGSGGPTTTVFVGNISEKASDMLVRQLLAKCGLVLSWKRVQGASGKLQAFGFCEYKEPESTLRSLRLLHELLLGDKKLLVKVDAKTKAQLEEWKAKRRSDGLKEEEEEEEDLDEDTKRRDQIVKGAIEGLIREYGSELNAPSQDGDNQPRKKKREKKEEVVASEDINVMEMEDDKRDLISREISKFRDTHKKLEEEKGKKEQERQEVDKDRRERDKERERERERRDREREKEKERNDNNNKERERDRDRDRIDRERERTKERERERGERERGERERGERERGERERGERERVKERSREVSEDRKRSRDEKKHDREEDQEEAYERRKLERKMRDKETAYQERLKNWEIRERKKARDYDKENQREEERRHEMTKEGKRLKEFLEDYDDDRDESKYYRGSALQKRLRDREKETELDDRDRKREKEEHDQIRQRLLAEGHPDPEAELQRMEEEAERRRQPPVKPEPEEEEVQQEKPHREREHREHRERETHPHLKPTLRPITSAPSVSSGSGGATPNSPGNESPCGIIIPHENSPEAQPTDEHRPKIGLSLKLGAGASPNHQIHTGSKRKKLANVDSVFNKFGEEEADEAPRKRKLVPLDYGEDDKSLGLDGAEVPGGKGGQNTEEKRKHIRSLIEKIPTARPELFNYPLDWTAVDSTLMDRRIRPWINKKIIEYIGEEEATLVDFVCSKVMSHGTPQGILDDVAMVLDEEAEVFIVKMWRLLIYETEAKKIGLGK